MLIFLIIAILLLAFFWGACNLDSEWPGCSISFLATFLAVFAPGSLVMASLAKVLYMPEVFAFVASIVFTSALWFVIGALIGLVLEKANPGTRMAK